MGESWGCGAPSALLIGLVALIAAAVIAAGPVPGATGTPTPTPIPPRRPTVVVARCVPGRQNCGSFLFRQP